ncbi:histone H2A deubiquitinase MYSM1 isoform X2 [Rhinatrema bivittatum]|uniref:histone H2A deubiquitinase MYSM1 isoform X2 n=1 Tax=Rhinatrema bivittatum TaxID=194408 RepID=UPI00112BF14A|nr:histone H2A deubiquitinase MYSM1 isoform X2 [Rhinatrema bivittatum]
MAEEADVDIEGDEAEVMRGDYERAAGGFKQDPYLDSTWRTDIGLTPWTLDNSISEENRAIIQKMLLEEEYYLSNKPLPQNFWPNAEESGRRYLKRVRTSTKPSSSPIKWTMEEKELFDQGLAKFGRRWTKIAKLVGSRTVLQVKSYARHYLKSKSKLGESEKEEISQNSTTSLLDEDELEEEDVVVPAASAQLRGRADPNLNAVKIEKLSDDEEVDITDEIDELLTEEPPNKPDLIALSEIPSSTSTDTDHYEYVLEPDGQVDCLFIPPLKQTPVPEPAEVVEPGTPGVGTMYAKKMDPNVADTDSLTYPDGLMEWDEQHEMRGTETVNQLADKELCQEEKELVDSNLLLLPSGQLDEDNPEEEEELKPPEQEVEIDRSVVMEEEKQAIPEFFEGRQTKTPERYLKIRNYILDQWENCKPRYLNKTSVRPGLKNCGDVNCIGRIHTYLELIGAINFGCEQAIYSRPRPAEKMRCREGKDTVEAYQLAQRLQSMRTRRRRVRDPWGNWCDAKDLEGQTFEHLSAEELARRREEEKSKLVKYAKGPRPTKSSFDPFQLIPCCSFNEEKQEPFQVKVASEALLIMDLHAHVSMAEVIGLLGGRYSEAEKLVEICAAEPCNSLSTGLQCEMDPVSQTLASETLAARGYSVIGWYHSHPAFDPNPSIRDIDTQAKYQSYFSRGGAMFIGMIVSPYNRNNPLPYSQLTCLVISDELSCDGSYRLPYKFEVHQILEEPQWELVFEKMRWIIEKYRLSHSSVPMDKIFRRDSDLTCLQKLLACLRKTLEKVANCFIAEEFLTQIEHLFQSSYKTENSNPKEHNAACPKESST